MKDKQIDEMAKVIARADDTCLCQTIANSLYRAGYRKQREGEWVRATPCSQEYCTQCGKSPKLIFGILPDYCPHCGAKMKGANNGR